MFTDVRGKSRTLTLDGEFGFADLVKRYSGDLTARAVLDELVRVGTVTIDDAGGIQLIDDAVHVPSGDTEAQINILGAAGQDLFNTIDHNLESEEKRLQLTVAYNNLPLDAVRRFQHISHEDSLQLLKRFDAWLSEHDRDDNPDIGVNGDRYRAGIGIYYFEEPVHDGSSGEEK